jgi:hypothetical protein
MKKTIITICITLLLLSGCQPSPHQEAVVNKGDSVFETKLEIAREKEVKVTALIPFTQGVERATAMPLDPTETPSSDTRTHVLTDSHWTDEVALRNFTFTIDVDIDAPFIGEFPVYSVMASEFYDDDQRIATILDCLIQDISGVRLGGMTKEEYEKEMRIFLRGYYDDELGEYIEPSESEANQEMEEFLKAIESAPEENAFLPTTEREMFTIPASIAYHTTVGDTWDIQVDSQRLVVEKKPRGVLQPERWVLAGTAAPNEPKGSTLQNVNISQDEAEQIVESFFEMVQLGDFAISSIEKARIIDAYSYDVYAEGWAVECARICGQCRPFSYRKYRNGNDLRFSDEAYAAELPIESLTMFVDEFGIRQLIWNNPLYIVEKLTKNIDLIPFEDMKDIIRQTLRNSLSWAGEKASGSSLGNGRVTKIILSSCYIPQKDAPGKFYLTPTWFILAGFNDSLEIGVQPQAFAINAVDGTRIELKNKP